MAMAEPSAVLLPQIYRTWPKGQLVFNLLLGFSDKKMQKVYLKRLMPVCIRLVMLAAYFFVKCLKFVKN
jgi:hypothetical protein